LRKWGLDDLQVVGVVIITLHGSFLWNELLQRIETGATEIRQRKPVVPLKDYAFPKDKLKSQNDVLAFAASLETAYGGRPADARYRDRHQLR
jgi:hypothetical protein